MIIKRKSNLTGVENVRDIKVEPSDLFAWEAGQGSALDLMPYLSQEDRDFIVSGITKDEWISVFSLEKEVVS